MKLRVVVIASVFLVLGGSAMAFSQWNNSPISNSPSAASTSSAAKSEPSPLSDSLALFMIGAVGLGMARKHLKSAK